MLKPLTPENIADIRLSGHVLFVGRSSLEVAVKMEGYRVEDGKEIDETYMIGSILYAHLATVHCAYTIWRL